jgi:hypothetical protein
MRGIEKRRSRGVAGLASALILTLGTSTTALAHDPSEMPPASPAAASTPTPYQPPPTPPSAQAPPPSSLVPGARPAPERAPRAAFVMIGAGAVVAGLGTWLTVREAHESAGSCVAGPGPAQCPAPRLGAGGGVALLVLGAGAALGGVAWLIVDRREHRLALTASPSSVALAASF